MSKILIIDDDPDIRAVLGWSLKSAGYEVALAADGREGLNAYRAQPADLVITDLYMPNQDGLETIHELDQRYPRPAIIAMSGRAIAGTMLSIARKLGAIQILQKPFSIDDVLQAVTKALPVKPPGDTGDESAPREADSE
jgi:CheY-like chemotaxis protein